MLTRRSFLSALAAVMAAAKVEGAKLASALGAVPPAAQAASYTPGSKVILCPAGAPPLVRLAASEIRRYIFQRTGELLPIKATAAAKAIALQVDTSLQPQQYRLQTHDNTLTISGGTPVAVLYGAYHFVEKLGVRFYLHGDVIPDGKIPFQLPVLDEAHTPLFPLRGVNPWGSHPFGFDAWGADDYKAIFTQLAKLRMNFLGLHCYPEGAPYAEPTVWMGLTGDFDQQGRVKTSYVSHYYNTLQKGQWGPILTRKTSDFSFGAAQLFESDDWAPPVMAGHCPLPVSPDDCNDVFNRTGLQFRDAFTFARQLGMKTAMGTETPMTMPKVLQDRLKAQGKDPADPAAMREVYQGIFRRIMATHPLDYFWLWTPEGWQWFGNNIEEYKKVLADIHLAIEAAANVGAPFKLATSGWVLGPAHDRAVFDADLPKNLPMSGLSQMLGTTPVDPAFARIQGRDKWAIPWLESDYFNGLGALQLEAGRMRRDAADALAYNCNGLMGLHWRTEIISPNISALAQAAWDQSWSKPTAAEKPRTLPCDDFYADWAQANFGLADIGKVFAAIDGKVPQSVDCTGLPGCPSGRLTPDKTPWKEVAPKYEFVDQLQAFSSRVQGAGNLARFHYWLSTFSYHRSIAQLRCALAQTDTAEIARIYGETYGYLLASVNTPGALAMVVNFENHDGWSPLVAQQVKQAWPSTYTGAPRLFVPTVRSLASKGEAITLKLIALDKQPVKSVTVKVRPLGQGPWQSIAATHVARAVWQAKIPPALHDIEYHAVAECAGGQKPVWPPTAPDINQAVIVTEHS